MKRCTRCERDLPRDAFSKREASRDGLQHWCRECNSRWARDHRPRRYKLAPDVPSGQKWCRRCEKTKPQSAFARNAAMKDGLQGHCRDCQADAYRSRRETDGHVVRPADIPEGHKFCRGCGSVRPLADFAGRTGRRTQATFRCNDCMRQDDRERHFRRTYAMTAADVAEILASQGGVCAICRSAPAIHIDHDHATGAVRGMLCFRCNAALGQLGDSPEVLVRAARYLLTAADLRVPFEVVWTERLAQVVEYDGSAS